MRHTLVPFFLLCCLFFVSAARASDKPKPKTSQAADYSCNYYCSANGKYYCVETSATCSIGHAYVKESGSTASPVLVTLSLYSTSGSCNIYEGSITLSTGIIMVIDVQTCDCGNSLTTYVFFTGSQT